MTKNNQYLRIWHRSPWKWCFSLTVGIILLTIVTLTSIYGTLIAPLEKAQRIVYYSWWYETLLLLLAINITCATLRTIVDKILPFYRPRFQRITAFYETNNPTQVLSYNGDFNAVAHFFHQKGFNVFTEDNYGYARKGISGRWGAPISHLGFIIVLLGGFASGWVASEGVIRLMESQETDKMTLSSNPPKEVTLNFRVRCDDFDTEFFPKTRIPAKFTSSITILENDQVVESGLVEVNRSLAYRGWVLHQTSYETLDNEIRFQLGIAHPEFLTTTTLEISQGQNRLLPGLRNTLLSLQSGTPPRWMISQNGVLLKDGILRQSPSSLDRKLLESKQSIRLKAVQFEPDFVLGPDRIASSRSQNLSNPALRITLYDGETIIGSSWLFGREDMKSMMHAQAGPYKFELRDITGDSNKRQFRVIATSLSDEEPVSDFTLSLGEEVFIGNPLNTSPVKTGDNDDNPKEVDWRVWLEGKGPTYATVLTMTRNPAIPFIYGGCVLMMVGLMVAFFIRRKEVWFWIDTSNKLLHISALYRHPQTVFDKNTLSVISSISQSSLKEHQNYKGEVI